MPPSVIISCDSFNKGPCQGPCSKYKFPRQLVREHGWAAQSSVL